MADFHTRPLDAAGVKAVQAAMKEAESVKAAPATPPKKKKCYCFFVYSMECSPGYFGPKDATERARVIKHFEVPEEGETWEHIRYLIETEMGVHSAPRQRKSSSAQHAYAEGYLYDPEDDSKLSSRAPLQKGALIKHNDKIIVCRRCSSDPPWVPARYAKARAQALNRATIPSLAPAAPQPATAFAPGMTEEEKMKAVANQAAQAMGVAPAADKPLERRPGQDSSQQQRHQHQRFRRPRGHAADVADAMKGPPPAGYVCHRCERQGHWKAVCPTRDDPSFRPRDQIPYATGVPRHLLRTAEGDADMKRALRDPKNPGRFVVRLPADADLAALCT